MQYTDIDKTVISAGVEAKAEDYRDQLLNRIVELLAVTSIYMNNTDRVMGPQTSHEYCDTVSSAKMSAQPYIAGERFFGICDNVFPQYTGQTQTITVLETPFVDDGVVPIGAVSVSVTCSNTDIFDDSAANTIYSSYEQDLVDIATPAFPSPSQNGVYQRMTPPELRQGLASLPQSARAYTATWGAYHNMSMYVKYSTDGVISFNSLIGGCGVLAPLRNTDNEAIMNQQTAGGCIPYDSLPWYATLVLRSSLQNQQVINGLSDFNNTDEIIIDRGFYELDVETRPRPEITQITWSLNRASVPANI
jgi:hypothetical protein